MALRQALARDGIRLTSDRLASSDRNQQHDLLLRLPKATTGGQDSAGSSSDGTDGPFASIAGAKCNTCGQGRDRSDISVTVPSGRCLPSAEPIVFTHD